MTCVRLHSPSPCAHLCVCVNKFACEPVSGRGNSTGTASPSPASLGTPISAADDPMEDLVLDRPDAFGVSTLRVPRSFGR